MDIPVVSLTYNRPEYLRLLLDEHNRVNSPTPIHVVDDGSDNVGQINLLDELEKDDRCVVHRFEHLGHRLQVLNVIKHFNDLGHEYIAYVEDDSSFSINWYEFGIKTLSKLQDMCDVGTLALYSGHSKLTKQVFGNVFKHTDKQHFYGSCCAFIKTSLYARLREVMFGRKGANNPDVAIRWLSMFEGLNLFVVYPNLAQHEGTDNSVMKTPKHHSSTFYGVDKDALDLL